MNNKMTGQAVEIKNLSFSYSQERMFQHFNLEVGRGEFVCIVGKSGCGKSTLLKLIQGLEVLNNGVIELHKLTSSIVFQKSPLFPWMTIRENIRICIPKDVLDKEKLIDHLLEKARLMEWGASYPGQLSGGMQQRVNVMRSLSTGSEILLMDEPFVSVDALERRQLSEFLLALWREEKKTIVYVTHDIDEALRLGQKVFVLSKKSIKEAVDVTVYDFSKQAGKTVEDMLEAKKRIEQELT